jgi:hypothetical protein
LPSIQRVTEATMPVRHAIVAVLGVLALLISGSVSAAVQDPLGTACPMQAENDTRVRGLFGPLLRRFADVVGRTVGCIADAPDGGLSQPTTTGLLYARAEDGGPVRIIVFTDGHRHWAVDANLRRVTLYWEGDSSYPPAQGVTRIPLTAAESEAEAPWPGSPAPTVGRAAPTPTPAFRPETGENITPPTYEGGRGELMLKNDLTQDMAFKLRDDDGARGTRAFVYVRAHEQAKLELVSPGAYRLQGISGVDWDPESRLFRRGLRAFESEPTYVFEETTTDEGIGWSILTLTIYPIAGTGDIGMSQIDVAEFLKD